MLHVVEKEQPQVLCWVSSSVMTNLHEGLPVWGVQTLVCKRVCPSLVLYKLFKHLAFEVRAESLVWEQSSNSTVRLLAKVMRALPCAENELREQRRLMEAVRGILTSSVQSGLGSEQQAFLQNQRSWEPPAPSAGTVI